MEWTVADDNLKAFRARVQELLRRSIPYDDHRKANQQDLAEAVGLSRAELNKRLHGTAGKHLTERDGRAIVRTLAEWGTLQTQAEAVELLSLVGCASFTAAEWQAAPLDHLTPPPANPASAVPASRRSNLPVPLTSFLGRERELAALTASLQQSRLLSVVGPGGVGKTRLALALAKQVENEFAAVYLVELAALSEPALLTGLVAASLGVAEQAGQPLLTTLLRALQGRDLLLVLDNCEHLSLPVAKLAETLLKASPQLRILTTSREPLAILGETTHLLHPLPLPTSNDLPNVGEWAVVQLFVARAQAVCPGFALATDDLAAVVQICRQLDGLPLAIELAAARMRLLSVRELVAHLDDALTLLTNGSRTALPRQQTLAALLDWSYCLLTTPEQSLLRGLAIFADGFTLAAAAAVSTDADLVGTAVLTLLGQLVSKSLVVAEQSGPVTRYRLLVTIQQYALAQLRAAGEEAAGQQRQLAYYIAFAEQGEQALHGAAQLEWLPWLEQEHANLQAVLTWHTARPPSDQALRLAGTLAFFWSCHSHLSSGLPLLQAALAANPDAPLPLRAKATYGAGLLAYQQGAYPAARELASAGLELYRCLADPAGLALSHNLLTSLALVEGDIPAILRQLAAAVDQAEVSGDGWVRALIRTNQGRIALTQGQYATAQHHQEAALQLWRASGDRHGIASALGQLGVIRNLQGHSDCRAFFAESLTLFRALGDRPACAIGLLRLGIVLDDEGDLAAARNCYEEALQLARTLGHAATTATVLGNLGMIRQQEGDFAAAHQLLAESLALWQSTGYKGGVGLALRQRGTLACAEGDYTTAQANFAASLHLAVATEDKLNTVRVLTCIAHLCATGGELERAVQLLAATARLIAELAANPYSKAEQVELDQQLTSLGVRLGPKQFAAAWSAGSQLTMAAAVAIAG